MEYSDKLKNPLWQKKRLEILNRDNFTCKLCFDTQTELHIHHKEYKYHKEPWEYDSDNFETYCKHCHKIVEYHKGTMYKPIISAKEYKKSIDKYFIICVLYNSILDNYGISMEYINTDGTVDSLININERVINNVNNILQAAKILNK